MSSPGFMGYYITNIVEEKTYLPLKIASGFLTFFRSPAPGPPAPKPNVHA
jgi:hypothetical protein